MARNQWIGVDLDGTLATWKPGDSIEQIGEPIYRMVNRIKEWLDQGYGVRIMTARVGQCERTNADGYLDSVEFAMRQEEMITKWCLEHIGTELPVTCSKDFQMIQLWDDRAVQCIQNTGKSIGEHLNELANG